MNEPDYIHSLNQKGGLSPVLLSDRDEVVEYLTGKSPLPNTIDEGVRVKTMVNRSQLNACKVEVVGGSAKVAKKREVKAKEKQGEREKKVCEVILEHERNIACKKNFLQIQGKSFLQVLKLAHEIDKEKQKAHDV
jgi:hypothetical protein